MVRAAGPKEGRERALALLTLVLLGGASTACVRSIEVDYQVKDPGAVSVVVTTPDGDRTLLPSGREPREETVPRTLPPYHGDVLFEASAIRASTGAITMRCDACTLAPVARVLPADGHGHIFVRSEDEDRPQNLAWSSDELRIGYGYEYFVKTGRYFAGPYMAFSYSLAIPRGDVVSVREHRDGVRLQGVVGLLVAIPLSVLAVALIDDGSHRASHTTGFDENAVLEEIIGGVVAAPALAFDIAGAVFLFQPAGFDRSLLPQSPR